MRVAAQLARMGGTTGRRYAGLTKMERAGPVWTGETRARGDLLTWPLFRRQSRRIAVDLMSDLFHETLATATIDLLHAVIAVAHWHTFVVLTKRAPRMREYYHDPETPGRIAREIATLSSAILPTEGADSRSVAIQIRGRPSPRRTTRRARSAPGASTPPHWIPGLSRAKYEAPGASSTEIGHIGLEPWPLPNLWLGVSVEDQNSIRRLGDLLETPAALRWVCFEPLLDRVRPEAVPVGDGFFDALTGRHYAIDGRGRVIAVDGPAWRPLDWVVVGGEIGAGARPTQPNWIRAVRDQCVKAGVPFFFRQWGEWAPPPDEPSGQITVRVGKRTAGRLLDGRIWDEIPPALPSG